MRGNVRVTTHIKYILQYKHVLRYLQCCSVDESPKSAQKQEAAEAEDEDLTFVGDIPEFAPEQHPMRGNTYILYK